jgi:hypothetical protein
LHRETSSLSSIFVFSSSLSHPQHSPASFRNRYDERYGTMGFANIVMLMNVGLRLARGDAQQPIYQGEAGVL